MEQAKGLDSEPKEANDEEAKEKASNTTETETKNHNQKGKNQDNDGSKFHEEFSLTYDFYALMGGFVLDVSKLHNTRKYFTLTPNGILHLARRGRFLRVKDDTIDDKSKADLLAKGLVCSQVTWLLVQCVARALAHYPLSLLELHTFIHVLCALGMFCLWLKKSLDVYDPIIVDIAGVEYLVSLMLMFVRAEGGMPFQKSGGFGKVKAAAEVDLMQF